ncbi:hypothetical protein BDW59DRAFT_155633 [Aspergillus cavernicola]|uniref:Uncharacterized protein n=1 Tax=Aspergillus cavernicola TaxID=176166 RepID=A0ABR4H4I0_9EURO
MNGEVTLLDHVISQHGHKTVNLERLPGHLQKSKFDPPPTIEALQREIGRLRQELAYHEEARSSLMNLFNDTQKAYRIIHEALQTGFFQETPNNRFLSLYSEARKSEMWLKRALRHVSEQLAVSEVQLLNSYGISFDNTSIKDYTII